MSRAQDIIGKLRQIATDPIGYAVKWKEQHSGKVIGIMPMNFPVELVHAAGALPMLVQESQEPITLGRSLIFEFYCGYTRSLVDQAATGKFDVLDAIYLVDHCVALLGAADALRYVLPKKPVYLSQFAASMDEALSPIQVRTKIGLLRDRLVDFCGVEISDDSLRDSVKLFNTNRQLLRDVYDQRRSGRLSITAAEMQILVKSAMVMDVEEHTALLSEFIAASDRTGSPEQGRIRLHFSGHFCHAPKPELLEMIESCGTMIVDDDLFTGYRYISTDVAEKKEPLDALTDWYFERNDNVPCSTRAQKSADWESYLLGTLVADRAQGVIVLMPKFCEPHMLYYPELRKAFEERGVPHLLIETEHEGLALETIRVRGEAFIETIKRRAANLPELM